MVEEISGRSRLPAVRKLHPFGEITRKSKSRDVSAKKKIKKRASPRSKPTAYPPFSGEKSGAGPRGVSPHRGLRVRSNQHNPSSHHLKYSVRRILAYRGTLHSDTQNN